MITFALKIINMGLIDKLRFKADKDMCLVDMPVSCKGLFAGATAKVSVKMEPGCQQVENTGRQVADKAAVIDEDGQQVAALRRKHRPTHEQAEEEHQRHRNHQHDPAAATFEQDVAASGDKPGQGHRRQPLSGRYGGRFRFLFLCSHIVKI